MRVKALLADRELFAKKRFGQNFLHSEAVVQKIVDVAGVTSEDVILEIGTGLGILTKRLGECALRVITFEKDASLVLPSPLKINPNIEFVVEDFMTADLSFFKKRFERIKVVANLPYNLSTEILFKFFEHRKWIQSMTLMFQKEVAERIVAGPGTKAYGILSVFSKLYSEPLLCLKVSRGSFYPAPSVDSAVVHFRMKSDIALSLEEEGLFKKVVKAGFGQRRKMLRKALESTFSKKQISQIAENYRGDLTRRLESFDLREVIELTKFIRHSSGVFS